MPDADERYQVDLGEVQVRLPMSSEKERVASELAAFEAEAARAYAQMIGDDDARR